MKKAIALMMALLMLLPLFCACSGEEKQTDSFLMMDTLITVTLYASAEEAQPVFEECRARMKQMNELWSRTKKNSDVYRFNTASFGECEVDERTAALVTLALEVGRKAGGAFNVAIAPVVDLWKRCNKEQKLPADVDLKSALALASIEGIKVKDNSISKMNSGIQLDLGGIGKGAAMSALIEYLESTDIRGGIVSFGSNVAVFGTKPDGGAFRVAVRDPFNLEGYMGTLTLDAGEVLSISGDYERFYTIKGEKYHHIIDPKTGFPSASGLTSVAVVCKNGALADALSTALFVMGAERAFAFYNTGTYDFEAIFVYSDGTVSVTSGMTRFEKN